MTAINARILLLEDDTRLSEMLVSHFSKQGWETTVVHVLADVASVFKSFRPDLIILDRNLPDGDGIQVCKEIRSYGDNRSILMLTGYCEELDIITGLEAGADDYIAKPFRLSELIARIKALLRRSCHLRQVNQDELLNLEQQQKENIIVNTLSRRVFINSLEIELTAREFDLLAFFAERSGRVCTRSQILSNVWNSDSDIYEQSVNTIIKRLRQKIEPDPSQPSLLETIRGVGYRFNGIDLKFI